MVSRINKLHNAIQGAKVHLSESVEQHSNHELKTGETEQISDSRMSRLIGKNKHNDQRKPLLLRVGTKNRPTIDLIADGILGEQSHEYQPKLDVGDKSSDLGKSVADRIKSLRQRTLTKISSDTSVDDNAFFGFEGDGTPIWSSVLTGDRIITDRTHHAVQSKQEMHHHSTHIPVSIEWPKQLQFSSHNNFRTWFTVSENRRATQLAEQVIDHAQNKLNPLIIVGESGTGKSHLLNAIGQAAMVSNEHSTYFVRANELPFAVSENHNWTDILSQASMLIIDDIDHSLENDDVANTWGNIIDLALNMNVHVIVSSTTMPQGWPATKLWDLLRTGVKTILGAVGIGSLMLYSRNLTLQRSMVLNDEQLALVVRYGSVGWRATRNAIDKLEAAVRNGVPFSEVTDVYNILNDIEINDQESSTQDGKDNIESLANRMIKSATDVVYSEQEFGGIELNSELPNLSDDYEPPELEQLLQDSQGLNNLGHQLNFSLESLTPEAPSVIDMDDRDKHLVAEMNRIIERDHSIAADILTDLDMSIDEKMNQSDYQVHSEADILANLESRLLKLASRTSEASIEGLIDIADELRGLEHELLSVGNSEGVVTQSNRQELASALDSYVPENEWNVDESDVSIGDLTDDESVMIPIEGLLRPHPEGAVRTAKLTPVGNILSGEEE